MLDGQTHATDEHATKNAHEPFLVIQQFTCKSHDHT